MSLDAEMTTQEPGTSKQDAEAEATEPTESGAIGAKAAQGSGTPEGSRAGLVPRTMKSGAEA